MKTLNGTAPAGVLLKEKIDFLELEQVMRLKRAGLNEIEILFLIFEVR